jgi:pimeloyl-ACP methyl ester carboxylesterase
MQPMHFDEGGAGGPAFVFVHGFTRNRGDWQPQMNALQTRHRVAACDLRGHGDTPGVPEDCTIEVYGRDVAELGRSLGPDTAILVGHSLGCRVVLEAARNNPDTIAGVVLIDGSCTASGDPAAAQEATRSRIREMGYAAFAEERFHDMFPVPNPDAGRLIAESRRVPAAIGEALFPAMSRWDAAHMDAALTAVGTRMMVIQSTYLSPSLQRATLEPGGTSPWLDRVRHLAPGARIEIVPGVGHFTQLEAADRVNALLVEFAGYARITR